ncbi:discoidin domain-containing protein [Xylophilus ampelinus]|nr:discoidin domain-containing protein [Xylophilus ampelinus]MCS4509951.1 discoidin domain-containing protein [Xylophilus ampelinus]
MNEKMKKYIFAMTLFAMSAATHAGGEFIPARISNASAAITNPNDAADNNADTLWNAGGGPTQWIDLDLGFDQRVRQVRLQVGQAPEGPTTHNIYGRNSSDQWFYFGSISQYTFDYQWLSLDISDKNRVRYIVVQTTSSPSWVASREITAYKPYPEIRGYIDAASLQSISGWACEFREEAPRAIHIYRNERVYLGNGNYREDNVFLGGGSTGSAREQAVQNSCETSSANFGFNIPLTVPNNLLDGKS